MTAAPSSLHGATAAAQARKNNLEKHRMRENFTFLPEKQFSLQVLGTGTAILEAEGNARLIRLLKGPALYRWLWLSYADSPLPGARPTFYILMIDPSYCHKVLKVIGKSQLADEYGSQLAADTAFAWHSRVASKNSINLFLSSLAGDLDAYPTTADAFPYPSL